MRETCERHVSRQCHWADDLHAISSDPRYTGLVSRRTREGIGSEFVFAKRDAVFFVLRIFVVSENRIKYVSRGKDGASARAEGENGGEEDSRNYLFGTSSISRKRSKTDRISPKLEKGTFFRYQDTGLPPSDLSSNI